jgi:hypothetical protein
MPDPSPSPTSQPKAKTPDQLRDALRNKAVMEIYSERDRSVVGFHILFWTPLHVHLGLVMIAKCAQGRKLQQVRLVWLRR